LVDQQGSQPASPALPSQRAPREAPSNDNDVNRYQNWTCSTLFLKTFPWFAVVPGINLQ